MTTWQTTVKCAVLFSGISGSSRFYKEMGDQHASTAVTNCVAMMHRHVLFNSGTVVKTNGEEVMARFDSAAKACHAAVAIQRDRSPEIEGLSVRIGIGYGKAIKSNDDLFGEVVNDAFAVAKITQAKQILLTQECANELKKSIRFIIAPFDRIKLGDSQDISTIYRIGWETSDTKEARSTKLLDIKMISKVSNQSKDKLKQLNLFFDNDCYVIGEQNTPFIVGRDESCCDLAIDSSLVSRDHLHILYKHGKFVLVDHSTNGTYIKIKNGSSVFLRREEIPLTEQGKIALGQSIKSAENTIMRFTNQ